MPSRKTSTKASNSAKQGAFAEARKAYDNAMKLFAGKQDYAGAAKAFEAFLEQYAQIDGVLELTDRVRCHLESCRVRTAPAAVEPETGADWLGGGGRRSNGGRTEEARTGLERALAGGADRAQVYYARAAALAAAERSDEAIKSLRLAIEADPETRVFALGDPDFARLRELAGFVELVEPSRDGAGSGHEEVIGHDREIGEIPGF